MRCVDDAIMLTQVVDCRSPNTESLFLMIFGHAYQDGKLNGLEGKKVHARKQMLLAISYRDLQCVL